MRYFQSRDRTFVFKPKNHDPSVPRKRLLGIAMTPTSLAVCAGIAYVMWKEFYEPKSTFGFSSIESIVLGSLVMFGFVLLIAVLVSFWRNHLAETAKTILDYRRLICTRGGKRISLNDVSGIVSKKVKVPGEKRIYQTVVLLETPRDEFEIYAFSDEKMAESFRDELNGLLSTQLKDKLEELQE